MHAAYSQLGTFGWRLEAGGRGKAEPGVVDVAGSHLRALGTGKENLDCTVSSGKLWEVLNRCGGWGMGGGYVHV